MGERRVRGKGTRPPPSPRLLRAGRFDEAHGSMLSGDATVEPRGCASEGPIGRSWPSAISPDGVLLCAKQIRRCAEPPERGACARRDQSLVRELAAAMNRSASSNARAASRDGMASSARPALSSRAVSVTVQCPLPGRFAAHPRVPMRSSGSDPGRVSKANSSTSSRVPPGSFASSLRRRFLYRSPTANPCAHGTVPSPPPTPRIHHRRRRS